MVQQEVSSRRTNKGTVLYVSPEHLPDQRQDKVKLETDYTILYAF